jgi:hypothetical protein
MQVYQSVKRWRAPKDMPQAGPRTFTPGFQQQQQAAEERARHGNLQFAAGASQQSPVHNVLPADAQMSPPLQQTLRPPRLSHSQSRQVPFPGAMPNHDWGSFDGQLPASTSISPEAFPTPNYPQATPSGNLMPPPHIMSQGGDLSNLTKSNANLGFAAPTSSGCSPLDALNDIDWVRCSFSVTAEPSYTNVNTERD